ncbi:hypothetical protein AYI70_g4890 [Smittium culicis]|uniref:Uncharacterized protein n=1 Tax=Smittium culicis TaxID=133412 RepID=A0A1R1XX59_9FUNG|nr:hypothetical protein AYI70_g4890 [Smittium culicis]
MSENINKRAGIPDNYIHSKEDLDLISSKAKEQSSADEIKRNIRSISPGRPSIKPTECFYEPSSVDKFDTSSIEKYVINTLRHGHGNDINRNESKNHTHGKSPGESLSKYSVLPKLIISDYENEPEYESSDESNQSDTAHTVLTEHNSPSNVGSSDIANNYKYTSKESIKKINASFKSFEESLIKKIKQYSINFFSNFHELKTSALFTKSYFNSATLTNNQQHHRNSKFASSRSQEIKGKNSFLNDDVLNGFRSLYGYPDDSHDEHLNKKFKAVVPKNIDGQKSPWRF